MSEDNPPKRAQEEEEEEETEGEGQGDRDPMDYKKDHKAKFYNYCLNATEKDAAIPGFSEIVWSLFKQLKVGIDLSKVMLPVEFCESRSLLEKLTDVMSHFDFVSKNPENDALQRIMGIVKWMCSGWYIQPPGAKKPYNPVLGEVFRGHWTDYDDDSISTYFSEQVSHHPPITAFYGENKRRKVEMEGYYYPQSKFLGNSVAAIADGYAVIRLLEHGEEYRVNWPDYYFRGLFWGSLRLEISGTVNITCPKSKYSAQIKFLPKPLWGGDWNCIDARIRDNEKKHSIYYITGKWNEKLFIQKRLRRGKTKKELFFDPKVSRRVPFQVLSMNSLEDFESHKIWGELTKAVEKGSLAGARNEKHKVEEAQRARRRHRNENEIEYKQRFFTKNPDGSWKFQGKDHEMYKILLEKWLP